MRISVLIVDDVPLSAAQESAALDALPPARRAQLLAWPDGRARQRSLLGTRLLLAGLHRLDGVPRSLAGLRHPTAGKPTLDPTLDFSLSHCEGRVACALSAQGAVGLDVERVGPLVAGASGLYLSPAERAAAGTDPLAFYALWTRKEAVAKAAGSRGLRDLRAVQIDGPSARFRDCVWYTFPLDVGAGFIAHLACAEPATSIGIERIDAETLL